MEANQYLPSLATIRRKGPETDSGDVQSFWLEPAEPIAYLPGQCLMLSVFGVGESMISLTSSPTDPLLQVTVKRVGKVTTALHDLEEGDKIGIRGPLGNNFPVNELKGRNLLVVAGGFALAPVRSLIRYVLAHPGDYGQLALVYGARTPGDLCFREDLGLWPAAGLEVHTTVDQGSEGWSGPVGFVPAFLQELAPSPVNTTAVVCGPPVMIQRTFPVLKALGFTSDRVITTLEMKMQCGVGQCGRCNIGSRYVCVDGPVFTLAELESLPGEY